jgi:hypothetical protein
LRRSKFLRRGYAVFMPALYCLLAYALLTTLYPVSILLECSGREKQIRPSPDVPPTILVISYDGCPEAEATFQEEHFFGPERRFRQIRAVLLTLVGLVAPLWRIRRVQASGLRKTLRTWVLSATCLALPLSPQVLSGLLSSPRGDAWLPPPDPWSAAMKVLILVSVLSVATAVLGFIRERLEHIPIGQVSGGLEEPTASG